MIDITTILMMYVALLVVMFLHELGHMPEKIRFYWKGLLPRAAAIRAKSRLGGLIVNGALFVGVYLIRPEQPLLIYVGLIAWVHFISYAIVGGIMPEPRPGSVNIKTYVFDDVPNKDKYLFWGLAALSFIIMKGYYLEIAKGLFV